MDDYTATVTRLEVEVAQLKAELEIERNRITKIATPHGVFRLVKEDVIAEASAENECLPSGDEMPFTRLCTEKPAKRSRVGKTAMETVREMNKGKTAAEVNADDTAVPLDEETLLADRTRNVKLDDIPLAPCPNEKCPGQSNSVNVKFRQDKQWPSLFMQYVCTSCGMKGPYGQDEPEARAWWNGLPRKPKLTATATIIAEINANMKTHVEEFACAFARKTGLQPDEIQLIRKEKYEDGGTHVVSFQYEPKADYSASKVDRALAERVRELIVADRLVLRKVENVPKIDVVQLGDVLITTEAELMGDE